MRGGEKVGKITAVVLRDCKIIPYRSELKEFICSMASNLLFNQILYWAKHNSNPFYKFIQPCNHPKYVPGNSWCEELRCSWDVYSGAIKSIGVKISSKDENPDPNAMIWYWTSADNTTWFEVNWDRVEVIFAKAYAEDENVIKSLAAEQLYFSREIPNQENPDQENSDWVTQSGKSRLGNNYNTEITKRESSSSSEDDMNTCVHVRKDFDDDDLFKDLIDLGLSQSLAANVMSREPRALIVAKFKEISRMDAQGRIRNLIGYSIKAFEQKLYSPKQAERILGGTTQAVRKSIEEEPSILDIDISTIDNAVVEEYIETLKPVMLKTYNERGFDSLMLRAGLSMYDKAKRESING